VSGNKYNNRPRLYRGEFNRLVSKGGSGYFAKHD